MERKSTIGQGDREFNAKYLQKISPGGIDCIIAVGFRKDAKPVDDPCIPASSEWRMNIPKSVCSSQTFSDEV